MSKLKMLFVIGLSSLLIFGCKTPERPDAYECILINADSAGNIMAFENWYWFCKNYKTKEEKTKWLKDSTTCIRENTKQCKWIGTDDLEYEAAERFYLDQLK